MSKDLNKDRLIIIIIFHNTALWYQMLGSLEDSALFLETCILNLEILSMMPVFQKTEIKAQILSLECLLRMQLWALLSQLHRHQEALYHCQIAVRIAHFVFKDLTRYIESMVYRESYTKIEIKEAFSKRLVFVLQQSSSIPTNSKAKAPSPRVGSKLTTTRIEVKTDRSIDIKATLKSSRRGNPRETNRNELERNNSVNWWLTTTLGWVLLNRWLRQRVDVNSA